MLFFINIVRTLQINPVIEDLCQFFVYKLKGKTKLKDMEPKSFKMPTSVTSREKALYNKDFKQSTGMNKQKQPISMETTHLKPRQRNYVSAYLTIYHL